MKPTLTIESKTVPMYDYTDLHSAYIRGYTHGLSIAQDIINKKDRPEDHLKKTFEDFIKTIKNQRHEHSDII